MCCTWLCRISLLVLASQAQEVCDGEEMAAMQLASRNGRSAVSSFSTIPAVRVMCCANAEGEGVAGKAPITAAICNGKVNETYPKDGSCSSDLCKNPTYTFKNPSQGCSPYVVTYTDRVIQEVCWKDTWVKPDEKFCKGWRTKFCPSSEPNCLCDYTTIFKTQCPAAYSWQFDDQRSLTSCSNEAENINDMVVYLMRICNPKQGEPSLDAAVDKCLNISETLLSPEIETALAGISADERVLVVQNNRDDTVYPAMTGKSWDDPPVRIENSSTVNATRGGPLGFELAGNSFQIVKLPQYVQGGILWFRTGCKMVEELYDFGPNFSTSGGQRPGLLCETGQCIQSEVTYNTSAQGVLCQDKGGEPPATLMEFSFDDHTGGRTGVDNFDVSALDGPNAAVLMTPLKVPGRSNLKGQCAQLSCGPDLNPDDCPPELHVYSADVANASVRFVGCHSICKAISSLEGAGFCDRATGKCQTDEEAGRTIDGQRFVNAAVNLRRRQPTAFKKLLALFSGDYSWDPNHVIPNRWKVKNSTPEVFTKGLWRPSDSMTQSLNQFPGSMPNLLNDFQNSNSNVASSAGMGILWTDVAIEDQASTSSPALLETGTAGTGSDAGKQGGGWWKFDRQSRLKRALWRARLNLAVARTLALRDA